MDSSKKDNSQPCTSGTTSTSSGYTKMCYQDLDVDEAIRNALEESLLDCRQVNELAMICFTLTNERNK